MIRKRRLDLMGTACYEDPDAISLSFDGTTSDDEVTPVAIGDTCSMPFPDSVFSEACGSCFLELTEDELFMSVSELRRVLLPGALVRVKSCGYHDEYHDEVFLEAGFYNIARPGLYESVEHPTLQEYDSPTVWQKPFRNPRERRYRYVLRKLG